MTLVVFDTVVFVRALLNRRSIWAQLVFERRTEYSLSVSLPIVREVLDVLHRPELVDRFSVLPGRDVTAIIGILRDAVIIEIDEASMPRICRDPKDDKFLATAVVAGARYLVTEDKDLLVLGRYNDVEVVDAASFLAANE